MSINQHQPNERQTAAMRRYYRFHARIYDLTRWSFLFGRNSIVRLLDKPANAAFHLLEVGCGTGYNLRNLARRYPNARFTGVDVSSDMLQTATRNLAFCRDRVNFIAEPYAPGSYESVEKPDLVLFSYSLTMFNPGWEDALARAAEDLPSGGLVVVVDFHNTPAAWFRWWMGKNHVRMDGHLQPLLEQNFEPLHDEIRRAYAGLWRYLLFVGKKK